MPKLVATPPLSPERRRLVEDNVRLAGWAVRKWSHLARRIGDDDESLSVAYHGLVVAASRFDPARGRRFTTYAARCIFGFLANAAEEGGLIRGKSHGHRFRGRVYSLDLPAEAQGDEMDAPLRACLAREDVAEGRRLDADVLYQAIGLLPGREAHVLRELLAGRTVTAVARALGVSKQAVYYHKVNALERLRLILGDGPDGLCLVSTADHGDGWSPPAEGPAA